MASRDGRIVACGPFAALREAHPDADVHDLGAVVVVPGFVDAHCHLEWSLMAGLPEDEGFGPWLSEFLRRRPHIGVDDHVVAARWAVLRAVRAGTTTLADNGPTGVGVDALGEAGLKGIVHLEAFGVSDGTQAQADAAAVAARLAALDGRAGARVEVGISPHAPYSVGPGLWSALGNDPQIERRAWATHLAESPAELQVLADGTGPLAEVFAENGWTPGAWPGQGLSPVARLNHAGALRKGLVAAHCVQVTGRDAETLALRGVSVAHCPESNMRLRCGRAPVEMLVAAGVRVGLGTDSPASAGAYDVRAEARACRREALASGAPEPGAAELLRLATLGGAETLGREDTIGSLEPGKACDLVAITPSGAGVAPEARALAESSHVHTVVIDGEVVVDRGRHVSLDDDLITAAADTARTRIASLLR